MGTNLTDQNFIQKEIKEKIEVRKFLLLFGAESFVFQFAFQKLKFKIYYNFACYFVWV